MGHEMYEKFRWFFTSSGKLVIGGKSAEQNEEIVKNHIDKEDIVLHTASPGSPFTIIKSEGKRITDNEIREGAIFCASFSQQWKKGKKKTEAHVFNANQISKNKKDKLGTFQVSGRIRKIEAELRLALTIQNGRLRAVPVSVAKEKFMTIIPGKMKKEETAGIIKERLNKINLNFAEQEILQALPAGGFSIE